MKIIALILSLCFACTAGARGPVDPISPPWPLSISTRPMDVTLIPGLWVAYDRNAVWFIDIDFNSGSRSLATITLRSNALRANQASGWLIVHANTMIGELELSGGRTINIMMFRDEEGMKLRLASAHDTFYDLKLYKK